MPRSSTVLAGVPPGRALYSRPRETTLTEECIDVVSRIRREHDSLGDVDVDIDAYYGAQTARAMSNFQISGIPISYYPVFIRALAHVKKAAALANCELGDLDGSKAAAIAKACDEIAAGMFADQFMIDMFQGGAGTSTNMNMNEVVANRALEHLGFDKGRFDILHPNNDVNLSQSTNDVYPTAIRLALLLSYRELSSSIDGLSSAFEAKANEFKDILKLGRTQLQDAVPMTLGQEFKAFAVTLREDILRLYDAARLLREVNLGGTAIGTGITADPRYATVVIPKLAEVSGVELVPAADFIEACWDTGAFVLFSGTLKRTAVKLSKISNDLRLLSSGPRGGIGEINLPPMQPGSSIMPGKVNPVIPEVVNQVAFQVIGADLVVTLAAEAGQLQLNAMEPVIVFNLLLSIALLTNAIDTLRTKCVVGITADEDRCRQHLEAGTALATALTSVIGYEASASLAKEILASGRSLRELAEDAAGLPKDVVEQLLDVKGLTSASRLRRQKP
ncbi:MULTISPECIES: aspartate ammonia-lyase [unclassified Rhizobium]|mgnify:CR=1 FL=1|jgi:aspartate ammonia-lyase|uniref:aspartate ammonia-lyase n=1 Tax=unclassified Rhizobium TaxID=2613769 RepID=UPI0009E082DA|nr:MULTISPECIES: aspartate ammonia-lyase [unclassified Rhizobium]